MFKANVFVKSAICISLITVLSGCETFQSQEQKREQVHLNDAVVTANVKEALAKEPTLQKYTIDVQTVSGEVVLRGHVGSGQDIFKAAEIVNKVEGVQWLLNDLTYK